MRIYGGVFIGLIFLMWLVYHLLIKRDLKQNMTALYVYSSFIAVWGIIYFLMYI